MPGYRPRAIHICSFEAVEYPRPLTYDGLKAAVLEAGKFSVFEASEKPTRARMYNRLMKDPELEITKLGFPWTAVRRKATSG